MRHGQGRAQLVEAALEGLDGLGRVRGRLVVQEVGDLLQDPGHRTVDGPGRAGTGQHGPALFGDQGVLPHPLHPRHQVAERGVGRAGAGRPVRSGLVSGSEFLQRRAGLTERGGVEVSLGMGPDQSGHRPGRRGQRPAKGVVPPARPHQQDGGDAEGAGQGPTGQSGAHRSGWSRDRHRQDEGEQGGGGPHGRLRTDRPGEEHGEAEDEHADHGGRRMEGAQRAHGDQQRPRGEEDQVGAEPDRWAPTEVGEEEQGERAEDGEQGRLAVADPEVRQGEHPGHQDGGPDRPLGGAKVRIAPPPPLEQRPVARRRRPRPARLTSGHSRSRPTRPHQPAVP